MSGEAKTVCVLFLAIASIVITLIVSLTYYNVTLARIGYTQEWNNVGSSHYGPGR